MWQLRLHTAPYSQSGFSAEVECCSPELSVRSYNTLQWRSSFLHKLSQVLLGSETTMGIPTTAQGPAPAYDDIFGNHPVNRNGPSGSASAASHFTPMLASLERYTDNSQYAAVAQDDDVELHAHGHDHVSSPSPDEPHAPESTIERITELSRSQPHTHCELCDVQTAARQRQAREHEKYCCTMVAMTFSIAFVCAAIFGIVAISMLSRNKRHD